MNLTSDLSELLKPDKYYMNGNQDDGYLTNLHIKHEITVKKGNKSVKCVFASFTPSDGYFSVMLPDRTFKNVKEKGVKIRVDKKDYVHLPLNGGKKRRLTKKRKTLRKSKKSRTRR